MQRVKMVEDYRQWAKGKVYAVSNNEAHSVIDGGYGALFIEAKPKKKRATRDLRSGRSKRYHTK